MCCSRPRISHHHGGARLAPASLDGCGTTHPASRQLAPRFRAAVPGGPKAATSPVPGCSAPGILAPDPDDSDVGNRGEHARGLLIFLARHPSILATDMAGEPEEHLARLTGHMVIARSAIGRIVTHVCLRRSRSRPGGPLPVHDDGATDALVEHGARLVLTVDVAAAASCRVPDRRAAGRGQARSRPR